MSQIVYEQIWHEDQHAAGVEPILFGDNRSPPTGYVVVNMNPQGQATHRVFGTPVIPPSKLATYALFESVEDDFAAFPALGEAPTQAQIDEMKAFIAGVAESPPLKMARDYLQQQGSTAFLHDTANRTWEEYLLDFWFSPVVGMTPLTLPAPLTAADALNAFHAPGLVERVTGFLNAHTVQGTGVSNTPPAMILSNAPPVVSLSNAPPLMIQSNAPPVINALLTPDSFNVPYQDFLTQISGTTEPRLHRLVSALVRDGAALYSSTLASSCAFEHIFVGEFGGQAGAQWQLGGYHFWYKYQEDQARAGPGEFAYQGLRYQSGLEASGAQTPEMTSLSFGLTLTYTDPTTGHADTYFAIKETSSFFNGCSPEGLMALAMVRFYDGCSQLVDTQVNGANLRLVCAGQRYVRTFYPEFMGRAPPGGGTTAPGPAGSGDGSPVGDPAPTPEDAVVPGEGGAAANPAQPPPGSEHPACLISDFFSWLRHLFSGSD